jgi:AcrR family transcriptional regulator
MSAAADSSRKRSKRARQAILTAAFALLEEEGFERLSIEGIAARAGVGKTTIYRWWPTKGVLAVEAFLDAVTPAIACEIPLARKCIPSAAASVICVSGWAYRGHRNGGLRFG